MVNRLLLELVQALLAVAEIALRVVQHLRFGR
jgi:hypothetical protein